MRAFLHCEGGAKRAGYQIQRIYDANDMAKQDLFGEV